MKKVYQIFDEIIEFILFPFLLILFILWITHETEVLSSVRCDGGGKA